MPSTLARPHSPLARLALGLALAGLLITLATSCSRRPSAVESAGASGVLLLGNGEEPGALDPHFANSLSEAHVLFALFEGLVSPDPENPDRIAPGVAERWEFDSGRQTYRFHLRPDARWSDGAPVTAADFVGSAKRALSPTLGSTYPEMFFDLANAEAYYRGEIANFDEVGIRAEGERVLELRLGRPGPDFLQKLKHFAWLPVPIRAIEALGPVDGRSTRWARLPEIVSNGPFQLADWTPNSVLEVTRNPYYWDAANVTLNAIRFFPYEDAHVEHRAFLSGQLHVTDKIPVEQIGDPSQQAVQRSDPFLATSYAIFNTSSPKLADPQARQALALAIDKASLARDINRSGQPASAFTPPGLAGYEAPSTPVYRPDQARALWRSAIAAMPDGSPQLTFLVSNNPSSRSIAEAMQAMWMESLGINVELVNMEAKTLFSSLNAGDYEISYLSWTGDYEDPSTFLDLWRSGNSKNRARWSNEEYDGLLDRAAQEPDAGARMKLLRQAEALLLEQAPIAPIIWKTKNYCIAPSVGNWPPALLDIRSYKRVTVAP